MLTNRTRRGTKPEAAAGRRSLALRSAAVPKSFPVLIQVSLYNSLCLKVATMSEYAWATEEPKKPSVLFTGTQLSY